MIFPRVALCSTIVAALVLAPVVVSAQGPMSTGTTAVGTNDPFWDISVNGGTFYDAFVLNRPGGTATSNWIGARADGSQDGGAADGNYSRFLYSFRTTFTGTSGMSVTYECARDDTFFSVILNGATVAGATCPEYTLFTPFTISSGFNNGTNTLQFNIGGNGITDGLLVDITDVTIPSSGVPEPTSILLFASGLIGLAVAGRSRRKA
ncbi:MAG TPA: PEP-CTERM sorting domain-containing protein [Gemmatimonadaceae bacterium]